MSKHPVSDKSLSDSIKDGCAHAAMLGFGEAYIAPFAIFLGMGGLVIGLLASLPLFLGSFAQVLSVYFLDRHPHRKLMVVTPAALQALTWIPLFFLPLIFLRHQVLFLIGFSMIYYSLASFIAPAWNSWMGDLVSPTIRSGYFGHRDRLRTFFQLAGILIAGVSLNIAKNRDHEIGGFGWIFGLALLARMVSVYYLNRVREPGYRLPADEETFSFFKFLRRSLHNNFGRFTLFMAFMIMTMSIAGPFFALYMLRDLQFSYLQFTAATTMVIMTQALTFYNWGRLGDKFGNRKILKMTGLTIPIIPFLWLMSTRFEFILMIQALAGILWGGLTLSAANFIFDAVTPVKRARCVAYYNVLINSGTLIGAGLGGVMAISLPTEFTLFSYHFSLLSNLKILFLVSGIARIIVGLVFLPVIREVKEVPTSSAWDIILQVVEISPFRGWRFSAFDGTPPSGQHDDKKASPDS